MMNVKEEYAKVLVGLNACQRGDCDNCPLEKVEKCLDGAYSIYMRATLLLEAMNDWMVDNHLWDDFAEDIEKPLAERPQRLYKYTEITHKDADTSADATHPDHYNSGGMQAWDAMEAAYGTEAVQHFCLCNAMKYIWRQDKKNGREDVEKAIVYLRKWIELEEKC